MLAMYQIGTAILIFSVCNFVELCSNFVTVYFIIIQLLKYSYYKVTKKRLY